MSRETKRAYLRLWPEKRQTKTNSGSTGLSLHTIASDKSHVIGTHQKTLAHQAKSTSRGHFSKGGYPITKRGRGGEQCSIMFVSNFHREREYWELTVCWSYRRNFSRISKREGEAIFSEHNRSGETLCRPPIPP